MFGSEGLSISSRRRNGGSGGSDHRPRAGDARRLADLETPVSAFAKLRALAAHSSWNRRRRRAHGSLLVHRRDAARDHRVPRDDGRDLIATLEGGLRATVGAPSPACRGSAEAPSASSRMRSRAARTAPDRGSDPTPPRRSRTRSSASTTPSSRSPSRPRSRCSRTTTPPRRARPIARSRACSPRSTRRCPRWVDTRKRDPRSRERNADGVRGARAPRARADADGDCIQIVLSQRST